MRPKEDLVKENEIKLQGYVDETDDILEMVVENDDEYDYITEKDDESVIHIEEEDPFFDMLKRCKDTGPRGSIKSKKKKKGKIMVQSCTLTAT